MFNNVIVCSGQSYSENPLKFNFILSILLLKSNDKIEKYIKIRGLYNSEVMNPW